LLGENESSARTPGTGVNHEMEVVTIGLLKAIVGGTVGLVVGTMTCAPITGMVGGAFIAQDWE